MLFLPNSVYLLRNLRNKSAGWNRYKQHLRKLNGNKKWTTNGRKSPLHQNLGALVFNIFNHFGNLVLSPTHSPEKIIKVYVTFATVATLGKIDLTKTKQGLLVIPRS